MLPSLQDNALTRDDLRIMAKRQANEERRKRFLDARKRMGGLDVSALNQQVAEKQAQKAQEKEMEKLERQRILELQAILDNYTEEEKQYLMKQRQDLADSWKAAITEKSKKKIEVPESYHSSLPEFSGEDTDHDERVRAQQEQMRRWVQEQIDFKEYQKNLEKQQDGKYFEMMKAISEIREAAEREEQDMRKYLTLSVKQDNLELANKQKEQRFKENNVFKGLTHEDVLKATTLPINEENALDENGRILQRDLFRGYTAAQRQRIIQDNENIIQHKRELQLEEKRYNDSWAAHNEALRQCMEQNNNDDMALRREMNMLQAETIKQQIEEQKAARKNAEINKRGCIGPEFFSKFGTSCR